MLKLIKNHLLQIIDNIDSGNSNLNEEQCLEALTIIKNFSDRTERLSKYNACKYINVSRATFDNYIKEGKLPKGKKVAGFKELSYTKKDLDLFLEKRKNEKKHKG